MLTLDRCWSETPELPTGGLTGRCETLMPLSIPTEEKALWSTYVIFN